MQIVKRRKIYFAIAIVFILVGIVAMIVNAAMGNGAFNTDVEFSGGTSMDISIGKEFNNEDIAKIIKICRKGRNNKRNGQLCYHWKGNSLKALKL